MKLKEFKKHTKRIESAIERNGLLGYDIIRMTIIGIYCDYGKHVASLFIKRYNLEELYDISEKTVDM